MSDEKNLVFAPEGYPALLGGLKQRIQQARLQTSLSVNHALVCLYFEIGQLIAEQQQSRGWGSKVIRQLSKDLRTAFPSSQGFSARNLQYMCTLAKAYANEPKFAQQPVARLPWGHIVLLLDKVPDGGIRSWYARTTIENGWSRAILRHQIESGLHTRQGQAQNNFQTSLPAVDSELAQQILKDPYHFDFLTLQTAAKEKDIELGLLQNIQNFLLELGSGFAFVGSQYPLTVGSADFYIDLLFYHLKLRRYVVIDLKLEAFMPEHAGKMSFYLSAVDETLRHPQDQPSIGLILCKTKDDLVAEYTLRDVSKPIGVAEYRLQRALPKDLQAELPTLEQIRAELEEE